MWCIFTLPNRWNISLWSIFLFLCTTAAGCFRDVQSWGDGWPAGGCRGHRNGDGHQLAARPPQAVWNHQPRHSRGEKSPARIYVIYIMLTLILAVAFIQSDFKLFICLICVFLAHKTQNYLSCKLNAPKKWATFAFWLWIMGCCCKTLERKWDLTTKGQLPAFYHLTRKGCRW